MSREARAGVARERMIQLHVRHLPVLKGGRVVGFISARDLLEIEGKVQAELASLAFEPW